MYELTHFEQSGIMHSHQGREVSEVFMRRPR